MYHKKNIEALATNDSVQSTIGEEIERQSNIQPDQPAMVCAGSEPLSYKELNAQILEMRSVLRAAGLGPRRPATTRAR